ncbi:MAG: hypothetical protein HUU28_11080 [Planctomycetaceae bacterium]|nr:hypothetical protein [Planctomycetaceae bacterium]
MKLHLLSCSAALLLAPVVAAQQLISVDSSRALSLVDPLTGTRTPLGTVSSNAGTTGGLAYDPTTDTIYVTSTGNDSLYTLDLSTGTATLVGGYGSTAFVMHGLEFDTSTNTLYGVSSHDNGLYTINTSTGFATLIGTSGLSSFTNLGYDSTNDVLYATNSGTDSFYSIDRATGAATLIGALTGPTNPNGVAYDAQNDRLFMICNSTDTLYTIDRSTGLATAVGSVGSSNILGLVWLPPAAPPVVSYCTAGTTTNGCAATITASAAPSVTAANACNISVANVEGQKSGLIFYSITGQNAGVWNATSFLCVKSPTQRTGTQTSGGTVDTCDGTLSLDWNAYQAGNPTALGQPWSAGDTVQVQAWFRDPPAGKATNLSDAIEMTYLP